MRTTSIVFDDEVEGGPTRIVVTGQAIERKGGMRLNSTMKNEIINKALSHAFDKRFAVLLKEEQALSKAFWLQKFGKAKLAHAIALGKPFALVCQNIYGNKEPNGVSVRFNVGGHALMLRCLLPVTARSTLEDVVITDEALIARCRLWQDAILALSNEQQKVTGTLTGMLQGISTYASLEKNWPQGKAFYKHLPVAYPFRHQVPAVLVDELNTALGI